MEYRVKLPMLHFNTPPMTEATEVRLLTCLSVQRRHQEAQILKVAYCVNGQSELCRLIRGPVSRHKVGTGSLEKSTTVRQFKGADHIGSSIKDKAAHRTIAASLRA